MIQVVKKQNGLGDTVAFITHKTGVAYVVKKVSEVLDLDCGCEKRQKQLNNLIPYGKEKQDSDILQ